MCVVSAIFDDWNRGVPGRFPDTFPSTGTGTSGIIYPDEVSREEFDALRKEVEELKILVLAAKRFDESTDQPDCEMDEKIALLRQIAEMVGVDVDEVFGDQ